MDQASADMETETQKPQNQKNDKNGPKHGKLLISIRLIRSAAWCTCQICALSSLQLAPRKRSCSREFGPHYFWQLSLTMVKSVTVI
jgi:hypothetical protein